jgi:hypothetical protein
MTLGLAYWILMLIWFVFGVLQRFGMVEGPWSGATNIVLLFVLFALLGWQVFGPPLRK